MKNLNTKEMTPAACIMFFRRGILQSLRKYLEVPKFYTKIFYTLRYLVLVLEVPYFLLYKGW